MLRLFRPVSGIGMVVLGLLLGVLCGPRLGSADEWPQFRGVTGNGVATETKLPERWSLESGVGWRITLPGRANSSPVVTSKRVDLTTQTDDGMLWVLSFDRFSGKLLRKVSFGVARLEFTAPPELVAHRHNAATPTPVADEEHVWAFFGNGLLACVREETGAIVWQRDLARDYGGFEMPFGMASSPRLHHDLIVLSILTKGPAYVIAVDKQTGKTVWRTPRAGSDRSSQPDAYSSPMIWNSGDKARVIVSGDGRVAAYQVTDGRQVWSLPGLATDGVLGRVIASPAIGRNVIAVATASHSGGGRGQLLGILDKKRRWTYGRATPDCSTPVILEGLLYMVSDQGLASCLDAETGQLVWEKRLGGGPYHASVIAGDGKVYFLGTDGVCTVVQKGRAGRILARNVLPGTFYATPAACGNHLFLRAYEALYAVQVPTSEPLRNATAR